MLCATCAYTCWIPARLLPASPLPNPPSCVEQTSRAHAAAAKSAPKEIIVTTPSGLQYVVCPLSVLRARLVRRLFHLGLLALPVRRQTSHTRKCTGSRGRNWRHAEGRMDSSGEKRADVQCSGCRRLYSECICVNARMRRAVRGWKSLADS